MPSHLCLSLHARLRMHERGITLQELSVVFRRARPEVDLDGAERWCALVDWTRKVTAVVRGSTIVTVWKDE
jgi:hypothetical protein